MFLNPVADPLNSPWKPGASTRIDIGTRSRFAISVICTLMMEKAKKKKCHRFAILVGHTIRKGVKSFLDYKRVKEAQQSNPPLSPPYEGRGGKCFKNPFINSIQVFINILIGKSQKPYPHIFDGFLPDFIRLDRRSTEMRVSIDFNREFCRWAIKIQNVSVDTVLSPKLISTGLSVLQKLPQSHFRWRHFFAQGFSFGFFCVSVENLYHSFPHSKLPSLHRESFA